MDEKELIKIIEDYNSGDPKLGPKALKKIFEILNPYIDHYIKVSCASLKDADKEDIKQNAYIVIIENLPKYDPTKVSLPNFFSIYIKREIQRVLNRRYY